MSSPVRLALDHNFPTPIIDAITIAMPRSLVLMPVERIDHRLADLDDWKLIVALKCRGWDGLVTCDSNMLSLPREMLALEKTGLSLIVAEASGHDPILATGLILTHAPRIAGRLAIGKAQVFRLRPRVPQPKQPGDLLNQIAKHQNTSPKLLRQDHQLSNTDLQDPLVRR